MRQLRPVHQPLPHVQPARHAGGAPSHGPLHHVLRCINSCPGQAITLLGRPVVRQYSPNGLLP